MHARSHGPSLHPLPHSEPLSLSPRFSSDSYPPPVSRARKIAGDGIEIARRRAIARILCAVCRVRARSPRERTSFTRSPRLIARPRINSAARSPVIFALNESERRMFIAPADLLARRSIRIDIHSASYCLSLCRCERSHVRARARARLRCIMR